MTDPTTALHVESLTRNKDEDTTRLERMSTALVALTLLTRIRDFVKV